MTKIRAYKKQYLLCECFGFAVAGSRVVYHRCTHPSDLILWLLEFESGVISHSPNIFHPFFEHWQKISKRLGLLDVDG